MTESFDDQTPPRPIVLQPAARELTGAECDRGLLDVDVAPFKRGYASFLRIVYGSFHVLDYGLFYENLRRNAAQRTAAWQAMARQ